MKIEVSRSFSSIDENGITVFIINRRILHDLTECWTRFLLPCRGSFDFTQKIDILVSKYLKYSKTSIAAILSRQPDKCVYVTESCHLKGL